MLSHEEMNQHYAIWGAKPYQPSLLYRLKQAIKRCRLRSNKKLMEN